MKILASAIISHIHLIQQYDTNIGQAHLIQERLEVLVQYMTVHPSLTVIPLAKALLERVLGPK
jgi:hypothetical protein